MNEGILKGINAEQFETLHLVKASSTCRVYSRHRKCWNAMMMMMMMICLDEPTSQVSKSKPTCVVRQADRKALQEERRGNRIINLMCQMSRSNRINWTY